MTSPVNQMSRLSVSNQYDNRSPITEYDDLYRGETAAEHHYDANYGGATLGEL